MISIEQLLGDIQRSAMQANSQATAGALANAENLLMTLLAGEQRRVQSEEKLNAPVPRFMMLSVTWQCNLKCKGCYAANYTPGNEMDLAQIRSTIEQAIELGTYFFVIVGGEPLAKPGLLEMISEITGGLFFFFTNGTMLNESHAKIIAKSDSILPIISVEGSSNLTDQRRGGGVGEKVSRAMELLNAQGVAFGISSMVTRKNLDCVTSREWFDQVWQAGGRFAFLIDYVPLKHSFDTELVLTQEDIAHKKSLVDQRYEEARPLVLNFPPDEYENGGECQSAGCGFIHINADGFAEPCPFSHYAADNIKEKSFAEILQSKFLSDIRSLVKGRENPTKSCLLFQLEENVSQIALQNAGFCTENL